MTRFEGWSLVAAFGTVALSAVAGAAVVWQLVLLARTTKLDHVRSRRQATMEYLAETMDRLVTYHEQGVPDARDTANVAAFVQRAIGGDDAARKLIGGYLPVYAFLGVAAESDAFDVHLIDQAWGGTIRAVAAGYSSWIEYQRENTGEPRLYEDLERLAAAMTPRQVGQDHPIVA